MESFRSFSFSCVRDGRHTESIVRGSHKFSLKVGYCCTTWLSQRRRSSEYLTVYPAANNQNTRKLKLHRTLCSFFQLLLPVGYLDDTHTPIQRRSTYSKNTVDGCHNGKVYQRGCCRTVGYCCTVAALKYTVFQGWCDKRRIVVHSKRLQLFCLIHFGVSMSLVGTGCAEIDVPIAS